MLFYDLDLGAWVRNAGSSAPPQMVPVLTTGGTFQIPVLFVRGTSTESVSGGTFFGGIKIAGDHSGSYVASDASPTVDGDGSVLFQLDLDTTDAKAYFVANPTEETANAAFEVAMTANGSKMKTVPMLVVLQNDYLKDQ
jgi:hypothetical protein